ncbi:DUF882 domain-containing protein [Mesorhizobium sp. B2-3-5]|uniref:DUF882 domain-containing protein n=1 Tax=Mesorhizobium sp. B2-3-5 TaxID=2589958 RepID=UPI0015E34035|nr:DUF882 domain-containing protein [Mesorhizobium sp. B2-3-5]
MMHDKRRMSGWRARFPSVIATVAGIIIAASFFGLASQASAETRALKLYHLHTGEKMEIIFKRDGKYDRAGLRKINRFLRDWRRNQTTTISPRLLDLLWEVYRATNAKEYINVLGGFRAPETNSMLRSRSASSGVAEHSQHMLGKAIDFYIPGVPLEKLREAGLKMQMGGVGYYPRSGSPFVHLDVGDARMWPRMSRRELASAFRDGKTVYIPSDGKPLPGYEEALASYQQRLKSGEPAVGATRGRPAANLFASLFGGGKSDPDTVAKRPAKTIAAATVVPSEGATAEPNTNVASRSTPAPSSDGFEAAGDIARVPQPTPSPRSVSTLETASVEPGPVSARREISASQAATKSPNFLAYNGQVPATVAAEPSIQIATVPLPTERPELSAGFNDATARNMPPAVGGSDPLAAQPQQPTPPIPLPRPMAEENVVVAAVPTPRPNFAKMPAEIALEPGSGQLTGLRKSARYAAQETRSSRRRATGVEALHDPGAAFAWPRQIDISREPAERFAFAPANDRLSAKPALVLAQGFHLNDTGPAADHFTGSAVQFLPVRRFAVN